MNIEATNLVTHADETKGNIIKLAVLAVGGQGGGVLTNWIEGLARSQGYICQATSVAGVAQRTGATIYYIEMAPLSDQQPIFSLAPSPGDVDIMISAEMMEAGRAIMRGFVTPGKTTLIASTHRALAVSEKMVPGDGIASSAEVRAAAEVTADQLVMFDMDALAVRNGSLISSALFGALAGSGALPFPRSAFEDAVRASGKGVEASLRAFGAAFQQAEQGVNDAAPDAVSAPGPASTPQGPQKLLDQWLGLLDRVETLPAPAREMATRGLQQVVNFQDTAYGGEYLDRLAEMADLDTPGKGYILSTEAAKYIANAMAYDDVLRVADLKTRGARFARIAAEMGALDKTVHLTEFMHPRAEEIVGTLPVGLGMALEARPAWMKRINRLFNKGHRVRTHRLAPFLMLYVLGGLRRWRRRTLRHKYEQDHLNQWLATCRSAVSEDYNVAVEMLRCRRLIKGYSDTHARGLSKFDKVLNGAKIVKGRQDAAQWIARLREAALQDEKGKALDGAIQTIRSFT